MPTTEQRLHGNSGNRGPVALMIIDMINDLEFDDGERLRLQAEATAERILGLKQRFRKESLPVIYANDNFGRWQSNFQALVDHCRQDRVRGRRLAQILQPDNEDYFVLKAKHSAFYSTTMELLLRYLSVRRLVITGITTDICVLFTANDAYMRNFEIAIPGDCVSAVDEEDSAAALRLMGRVLKADTRESKELDLQALRSEADGSPP